MHLSFFLSAEFVSDFFFLHIWLESSKIKPLKMMFNSAVNTLDLLWGCHTEDLLWTRFLKPFYSEANVKSFIVSMLLCCGPLVTVGKHQRREWTFCRCVMCLCSCKKFILSDPQKSLYLHNLTIGSTSTTFIVSMCADWSASELPHSSLFSKNLPLPGSTAPQYPLGGLPSCSARLLCLARFTPTKILLTFKHVCANFLHFETNF